MFSRCDYFPGLQRPVRHGTAGSRFRSIRFDAEAKDPRLSRGTALGPGRERIVFLVLHPLVYDYLGSVLGNGHAVHHGVLERLNETRLSYRKRIIEQVRSHRQLLVGN